MTNGKPCGMQKIAVHLWYIGCLHGKPSTAKSVTASLHPGRYRTYRSSGAITYTSNHFSSIDGQRLEYSGVYKSIEAAEIAARDHAARNGYLLTQINHCFDVRPQMP